MPRNLARTLVVTVALATLGILANAPSALAYGNNTQWQTAFSGTCSVNASPNQFCPGGVHTGFWGWCAFGGSSPDGLTGTSGDCQLTSYFGPGTSFHVSFDGRGWAIRTGSQFVFPPGAPDFQFTDVTVEVTGPGAALMGIPTGVPFTFTDPNCPPMICDTGVPAKAGHFSLHAPGFELNIQVTKLP
jgi:hypothetical protein